jgi:two-component system response regulator CpxR
MTNLLIVDDDVELIELLTELLEQEGYSVSAAYDGHGVADRVESGDFDLVVLDVMLPGLNGLEVLRRIRERSEIPVIMLTARGEEVDRIVGLEMGADDYLPKPFNPRELTARIRAVLRRFERGRDGDGGEAPRSITVGDLELDLGARRTVVRGREVALTGIEFSLLEVLVRNAGTVVGRDDLSRQALGRRTSTFDRSLDVHLSNLRKKLGPLAGGRERIKTVRGIGYQYVRPAT